MALNPDVADLCLRRGAERWEAGRSAEARSAGNRVRYLLEAWATDTVQHALHACGARGLIRPSSLERIYRDFSFYVPYSALTKALSLGLLPGMTGPVSGFRILPATAVATSAALIAFMAI